MCLKLLVYNQMFPSWCILVIQPHNVTDPLLQPGFSSCEIIHVVSSLIAAKIFHFPHHRVTKVSKMHPTCSELYLLHLFIVLNFGIRIQNFCFSGMTDDPNIGLLTGWKKGVNNLKLFGISLEKKKKYL